MCYIFLAGKRAIWLPAFVLADNRVAMLRWIDSCQNRVSTDQYHMTVTWAQVLTYWVCVFFEVIRWSQAGFQLFKCTGNKVCLWAALWKFWFQTDFRRRNSDSFYRQGSKRQLALPSMVTLYVECLSPVGQDLTGVHLENLCSISKLFYW